MRNFLLLFLFSIKLIALQGQCYPLGVMFSSQEEIDLFHTNNPTCTKIEGAVTISGLDIKNLDSLVYLTEFGSSLIIEDNPILSNIGGLNNTLSIGDLFQLKDLPLLTSIDDLANITHIGGHVSITETGLTNFSGFNQLDTIHGFLSVKNNFSLISLEGLSNIKDIEGHLTLRHSALSNLSGLENLQNIGGSLKITFNDNLQSFDGLNNLAKVHGYLSVMENTQLTDITALMELDSVFGDFIRFYKNPQLASLSGLDNLYYIKGSSVSIHDNQNLSICGIPSICYHLTYGDYLSFYNNAQGCDGVSEIENTCSAAVIQGFIFADKNNNCVYDPSEPPLTNWPILAIHGSDTLIGYSDLNGVYKIFAQPETYQVKAIPPIYWSENCTGSTSVTISPNEVKTLNFFGSQDTPCPAMQVDISSSQFRACEKAIFYVDYCNLGTNNATNASLEVLFSNEVSIDSATLDYTELGDNKYLFNLGDVAFGNCDKFKIFSHLSCEVIENQVICATANILPNEICLPDNSNWNQASLKVSGSCTDSIRFKIKNVGEGVMESQSYDIIIEDLILFRTDIQLSPSESINLAFPQGAQTYTLQTDQVPFHPGKSNPLVSIEGCTNQSSFSTGYVLQFPEDDANDFISIYCQEVNLGTSNQSNFPLGYGSEHYISRGQDIEYKTSFKNTQNDTIQNVVIKSIISPFIDLTTLKMGASSHPYTFTILGDTIVFHFSRINLPHSALSPVRSQGFIKFKVSQKANLANGTIINNTAIINYGVQSPIISNTVFNTIEENFVIVDIFSNPNQQFKITNYPNPFSTQTTITVEGIQYKTGEFFLFNQIGQVIHHKQFSTNSFDLLRNNLPRGTYPIQIVFDKKTTVFGKVTIF